MPRAEPGGGAGRTVRLTSMLERSLRAVRGVLPSSGARDAKTLMARHGLPILFFICIALIVHRRSIEGSGVFINGDLVRPLSLDQYAGYYTPMWNYQVSISTLARLPQALPLLPFIYLADLLGMDSTQFLKVEFVVTFALLGFSMFYVIRFFIEEQGERGDLSTGIAALLGGLAYSWNGFVIVHLFHPIMVLSLVFAPLLLLALYLGLKRGSIIILAVAGLIWSIMCMAAHWMVFGAALALIVLAYFLVKDLFVARVGRLRTSLKLLGKHMGLFGLFIAFFILFSSYWLAPGYLMGSTSRYSYVITSENLDQMYLNIDFWSVLSMDASKLSSAFVFATKDPLLSSPTTLVVLAEMGVLLFAIAVSGILFRKRRGLKVMLLCMTGAAFAQSVMMTYWPTAGTWFVLEAPGHSIYGWAFRSPKFIQLLFLAIPILMAFSIHDIITWAERWRLPRLKRLALQGGAICVVLVIIMVPNWPLATGDYNGNLSATELPPEFHEVFDWLGAQKGDFKVLWVPDYKNAQVDWNKGLRTTKNIIALSSPKPTYYFEDRNSQPTGDGIYFLESLFAPDHESPIACGNTTVDLGSVLYPLGIRYVVFHDDNATSLGNENNLLKGLLRQKDLSLVKRAGVLYVLENTFHPEGQEGDVYSVDREVLVYGGLSAMGTLQSTPGFDPSRDLVIYGEQAHLDLDAFEDHVDTVVFDGASDLDRMALSFLDPEYFLVPFDATIHSDKATKIWSKKSVEDMTHPLVVKMSKDVSRDLVFGSDLVFTSGEGMPSDSGAGPRYLPVLHLGFENGTGPMNLSASAANLVLTSSNRSTDGDHSLKGTLLAAPGDDRTYSAISVALPMSKVHGTYQISADLAAVNANKLQVRVRFFDESGRTVSKVFLTTFTGDLNFTQFSRTVALPSTVTHADLSILTERPTTSATRWWLDNVTISLVEEDLEPNRLMMPFTASSSGAHEVLLRALRGEKGGYLGVSIDGASVANVTTRGLPSGMEWTDLGEVNLTAGAHVLAVDNLEGFNALNVAVIVPRARWEECKAHVEGMADRAIIVQTIEAEAIQSAEGALPMTGLVGNASGGAGLRIQPGGVARVQVTIVGDHPTSIFIKGLAPLVNSSLRVTIGDWSWSLNPSDIGADGWVNITGVPLSAGDYVLTTKIVPVSPLVLGEDFDGSAGRPWEGWANWTLPRVEWNLSLDQGPGEAHGMAIRQTTNLSDAKAYSGLRTQDIPVTAPIDLILSLWTRSLNANPSHGKVAGLNVTSGKWDQLGILAQIRGDANWKQFTKDVHVPAGYGLVRVVLNAGTALDPSRGNGTVWYDGVTLTEKVEHGSFDMDVVHVASGASVDGLEDAFGTGPAPLVEFIRHPAPNRIEVEVRATGPTTIVLREAFDDMWQLKDSQGHTYRSVPVAGMLNGFLVNATGNVTFFLEYRPQAVFEKGMAVTLASLAVLTCSVVAVLLDRKGRMASFRRRFFASRRRKAEDARPAGGPGGTGRPAKAASRPSSRVDDLSIVIPAFNEEDRIGRTLGDYLQHFEALYGERFEIVVITDGCVDRTCDVIASVGSPRLRHFDHPKRLGKGGAILEGFKHSRGQVICFVDADGSTPPDQLELLIGTLADTGCDAVIGSRYNDGGISGKRLPLSRRLASRGFNIMVRAIFRLPYSDTQCGAKVLRREAAEEVSDGLELTDWAFDVNLLYNARLHGLDVREVGIRWEDTDGSKLKMRRVVPKMFMSVIRLRCLHSNFRWLVQNRWARAVAGLVYGRLGASR